MFYRKKVKHPFRDFKHMGRNYIYTNKFHPLKGIMATVLGVLACVNLGLALYRTYQLRGAANISYGLTGLLVLLFSMIGLALAVISRTEKDKYYLFSYLGMIFNVIALAGILFILYAGVYGL